MMLRIPYLFLAVIFIVGIVTARYFAMTTPIYGALIILAMLCFLRAIFPRPNLPPAQIFCQPTIFSRWRSSYLLAMLLISVFTFGNWRYQDFLHSLSNGEKFILSHAEKTAPAQLQIIAPPENSLSENIAGFWKTPAILQRFNHNEIANCRVMLYGNGVYNFPRDTIITTEKLLIYPEQPPLFRGAFSYHAQQRAENLSGGARLIGKYEIHLPREKNYADFFDELRQAGVKYFSRLFPDQRGALFSAIIFGGLAGLSEPTKNDFRYSGLGHILAISGLHVGLIAFLIWGGLRFFIGGQRLPALMTLIVVILFIAISGARPSALRAGSVAILYLGGILLSRPTNFLNSLGLSTFVILGVNPEILFTVGFQFSYLAVIFIYCLCRESYDFLATNDEESPLDKLLAPTWKTRLRSAYKKMIAYLRTWFFVCLAAWLGTWILMADYFNVLSPIGLLVNIFATPLLTCCLIGGAVILFLPSSFGGFFCAPMVAFFADLLLSTARYSANIYGAWLTVFSPPTWLIIIYYAVFALYFCRRYFGKIIANSRQWYFLLSATMLFSLCSVLFSWSTTPAGIYVLPAKTNENLLIVTKNNHAYAIIQSAQNHNVLAEMLRFALTLRVRPQWIIAPSIKISDEFIRRVGAQEITFLGNEQTWICTDSVWVNYQQFNKATTALIVNYEHANAACLRAVKEKQLSELSFSVTKKSAPTIYFTRKMSLRKLADQHVFYTQNCTSINEQQHQLRDEHGVIFIDANGK